MTPGWKASTWLGAARFVDQDAEDELRARINHGSHIEGAPAEIAWEHGPDTDELVTYLGPELSRSSDEVVHFGWYESYFDGTHLLALRLVPTAERLEPYRRHVELSPRAIAGFENFIDHGPARGGFAAMSYYIHGADLRKLRTSGATVSWSTACLLHAAATAPLRELHGAGRVHGALTARRVFLSLVREDNSSIEIVPPVRLLAPHLEPATPAAIRNDLRTVAEAVFALTRHPDPELAQLLVAEGGRDVARDLVLQRGVPVDPLLADLVGGEVPTSEVTDVDTAELAQLWQRVIDLDPMIEKASE